MTILKPLNRMRKNFLGGSIQNSPIAKVVNTFTRNSRSPNLTLVFIALIVSLAALGGIVYWVCDGLGGCGHKSTQTEADRQKIRDTCPNSVVSGVHGKVVIAPGGDIKCEYPASDLPIR